MDKHKPDITKQLALVYPSLSPRKLRKAQYHLSQFLEAIEDAEGKNDEATSKHTDHNRGQYLHNE